MISRFADLEQPFEVARAGIKVATSLVFTEGPAVDADGTLYFT